jgi:predicted Ser/Thr protein kinase
MAGSRLAVAKIARFEFKIRLVENEIAIYQAIDGLGIGPHFLGCLEEHGRIMGFLVEELEGRRGDISDLEACQQVTKHLLGIVHGDLNRHNYILSHKGAALIDFENATLAGTKEAMEKEYEEIAMELAEETGRGAECDSV